MLPLLSLFVALDNRCLFRGLAYRFLAENAWAKDEYGVGLAYMMQVKLLAGFTGKHSYRAERCDVLRWQAVLRGLRFRSVTSRDI